MLLEEVNVCHNVRDIPGIEIAVIPHSPNVNRSVWMLQEEVNAFLNAKGTLEIRIAVTLLNVNKSV